jgi:hypothetical protein
MSPSNLFGALCHVVPWQTRLPVRRDLSLLQDAEFQILLRGLRYPAIRSAYIINPTSQVGSRGPNKDRMF